MFEQFILHTAGKDWDTFNTGPNLSSSVQPKPACHGTLNGIPVYKKTKKPLKIKGLVAFIGGEGGIRTHGSVATTPDFESGTFDHSATSPVCRSLRF